MANRTFRITAGTTRRQVTGDTDWRPNQRLLFKPSGGAVFVGGSDVTVDNGFPVADGEAFEDQADEPVYVVATSDVLVYVYQGGVR